MPTAIEIHKEWETEAAEMKAWLEPKKTAQGINFQGDDLKAFNDRNEKLALLHDTYTATLAAESAAKKSMDAFSNANRPNRMGMFGASQTQGGGASNWDDVQGQAEVKTLGQMFMESDEFKANSSATPGQIPGGIWKAELAQGSVSHNIKAALTTTTGVVPYAQQPTRIVPFATRRPVMRDLVPTDDLTGQLFQFIRQNVQIFGADIVAEGQLKPETSLGTERVVGTVEAIAHYIKITDQALRFIPGIQDLIDTKGTLGIQLAEEDKILRYNGSAGWKGFLFQTGVQTLARGADDQFTAFHQGMNLVNFTGFANVTGGVIHPNDWHKVVTLKDTTGRFIYGDPFAATQEARIWGVPLIATPVMTEGTVLIGDFVMDSKWWTASGIIVKVGYVGDDLNRNQQTIVVEEYGGLEIDRPASFVKITGFSG